MFNNLLTKFLSIYQWTPLRQYKLTAEQPWVYPKNLGTGKYNLNFELDFRYAAKLSDVSKPSRRGQASSTTSRIWSISLKKEYVNRKGTSQFRNQTPSSGPERGTLAQQTVTANVPIPGLALEGMVFHTLSCFLDEPGG